MSGIMRSIVSDAQLISPSTQDGGWGGLTREEADAITPYDIFLFSAPLALPVLAFSTFNTDVAALHNLLEYVSRNTWVQVDGGMSRTAALLPVLTGIVLPCVSFALGTLTATTISTLRQRQVILRTELNTEACLIRNVFSAIEVLFPADVCESDRLRAFLLLRQVHIHYSTKVLQMCTHWSVQACCTTILLAVCFMPSSSFLLS